MPSLIFHEGTIGENSEMKNEATKLPPKTTFDPNHGYDVGARRLMWAGVISILFVIMGLWTWSLKVRYGDLKWSATPESKLINITRDSWEKAFHSTSTAPISTEQLKNDVKESLAKLIEAVSSSSTVAEATSTNAASTTN